ncbi:hypothetical protein ACFL0W_02270 [Nanoarchaeota archaeon]
MITTELKQFLSEYAGIASGGKGKVGTNFLGELDKPELVELILREFFIGADYEVAGQGIRIKKTTPQPYRDIYLGLSKGGITGTIPITQPIKGYNGQGPDLSVDRISIKRSDLDIGYICSSDDNGMYVVRKDFSRPELKGKKLGFNDTDTAVDYLRIELGLD